MSNIPFNPQDSSSFSIMSSETDVQAHQSLSINALPNPTKKPYFLGQLKAFLILLISQRKRNKKAVLLELFWPAYFMILLALISIATTLNPHDTDIPRYSFPDPAQICDTAAEEYEDVVVSNSSLTSKSIPCLDLVCIPCSSPTYTSLLSQIQNSSMPIPKRPLNIATFTSEQDFFSYYHSAKTNFTGSYFESPVFPDTLEHIFGMVIHFTSPNLTDFTLFGPPLDIFGLGINPISAAVVTQTTKLTQKRPLLSSSFQSGILTWQEYLEQNILALKTNISIVSTFEMQDAPFSDQVLSVPDGGSPFALLPFYMTYVFLYSILFLVLGIVVQKEDGTRELVLIMGLDRKAYWLAFITLSMISGLFAILIILGIGSALGLFQHSNTFLLFIVFFFTLCAQILFGLVISTLFNKSKSAGSAVGLFVTAGAFGFVFLSRFYRLQNPFINFVFALIYLIPFGQLMHNISVLEFSNIGVTPETWNLTHPIIMPISCSSLLSWLFFSIVFFTVLLWYLEHVFGQPRYPFLFFTSKSYWFPPKQSLDSEENVSLLTSESISLYGVSPNEPDTFENVHVQDNDEESMLSSKSDHHLPVLQFASPKTDENQLPQNSKIPDTTPEAPEAPETPEEHHRQKIVQLNSLTKEYSRTIKSQSAKFRAVDSVTFAVYSGEIFVYLGKNGSGKSTTLRMISGLETPTSGSATIAGFSLRNMDQIRQNLGVVPQENVFFKETTANEHLYFFAGIKGVVPEEIPELSAQLLKLVGLDGRGDEFVQNFSGGMQRKLQFALSLIGKPQVLLLDELAAGMDISSEQAIWHLTQEVARLWKTAIILTTHNMQEAEYLAHRIGILFNGKLGVIGSPLQLKNHFGSGYIITVRFSPPQNKNKLRLILINQLSTIRFQEDRDSIDSKSIFNNSSILSTGAPGDPTEYSLKFSVPLESKAALPNFFAFLETSAASLSLLNWSILTSSLEEIFVQLVNQGGIKDNENEHSDFINLSI